MSLTNSERIERVEQYLADLAEMTVIGSQRTAGAIEKCRKMAAELRPVAPGAADESPKELCGKAHGDTRLDGWTCALAKGHKGGHAFAAPKEEEEPDAQPVSVQSA